jgi:hypothetical protein
MKRSKFSEEQIAVSGSKAEKDYASGCRVILANSSASTRATRRRRSRPRRSY